MENSHLLGCMQVFVSVADSGSFSESARRLGLSQPSVSRQVNSLETHLGVRLLQRTTRKLSLTEAGQMYYDKARQIQRDVIEAGQAIAGFRETPSGILKIGAPLVWTDVTIMPFISEFLERYPEIHLDIECTDDVQDVVEDKLDLVIRVGALKDSSYVAVPLANIRLVLCATPEYLAIHGTPQSPADVLEHNCIVYEKYSQWQFDDQKNTQLIEVSGTVSSNMVTVLLSSIQQHIGLSLLPNLLINDLLTSGTLIDIMPAQTISIKHLQLDKIFAMYSNRKYLPAKVRVFIDFFQQKFNDQIQTSKR